MPSASTISVSVRLHSSSSRCRSALERASRETSRPKTAPTSPQHTRPTRSLKPERADPPGILGERVLAQRRLAVIADLCQRRLAHVDHRQALLMLARDLRRAADRDRAHRPLPRPAPPRPCWPPPPPPRRRPLTPAITPAPAAAAARR